MKGIVFCALLLILLLNAVIEAQSAGQSADMPVKRGHYKLARVILEKRVAANSKDVESLVLPARVNLAYEKTEEAKKLLQQAVALQSGSMEAHLALAEAEQLENDLVTPNVVLAPIYSSRAQWAELDQMLADAEKHISDSYLPHNIAGRTPAALGGDNARAERYLRTYLAQEQEGEAAVLAEAYWRLDQVLEKEGKMSEALHELEIALQLKPPLNDQRLRRHTKT